MDPNWFAQQGTPSPIAYAPGGDFGLPAPSSPYATQVGGGQKSTLKDFLMDPSKMQAMGQGMQYLSGTIGSGQNPMFPGSSPVARQSNPTTPGHGLLGSAFGAAGQMASPVARMVMMRAPDGTTQQVPEAHVGHYTGLGAQVLNGSSY